MNTPDPSTVILLSSTYCLSIAYTTHSSDYPTCNSEAMASLLTAGFQLSLLAIVAFCVSGNGKEISRYYITPDPETSCGEDHEPCLTLDEFAFENRNESVTYSWSSQSRKKY